MSSREFVEWMAYFTLEPFGDEWRRTATMMSLIANVNRDPKKRPEPFTPEDFMPFTTTLSQKEREQEGGGWQETKRRFMALVSRKDAK